MKSIRRRISAWMLPGLAAVWIMGGTAVYRAYRSATISAIDSENMAIARLVRANQRSHGASGGPGWRRMNQGRPTSPDLTEEGLYYQVSDLDGEIIAKSSNLGEAILPLPQLGGESIDKQTLALPQIARLRTVGTTFGTGHLNDIGTSSGPPAHAGGGSMPMIIVVGQDLSEADAHLRTALICITGSGLLMLGGMALLLNVALRDGLKPLDRLVVAISDVHPSSLNVRFTTGGEPQELKPIVSHLDRLMERVEVGFLRERRFAADLAHELRTPIAEMRTKLELASKWPEERTDELFNAAREINGRMQRVVDTMLHLAHLDGHNGTFPIEKIQLAPLVAEIWEPLRTRAEDRHLKIEIHCPDDVTIQGCPELWKHILANLLANSVEYTPPEGSIRLDTFDNGISISNTVRELEVENMAQLFERFWRADGSRSDHHHSGLGLSVVESCAHTMGYQTSASLEERGDERHLIISVKRKSAN